MSQSRGSVTPAQPPLVWPPDDTEESVLGTNLHQATITNLRLGLNEIAAASVPVGQAPTWQALSQTMITGFRRRDGTRYQVLPDVFVYRRPIDLRRTSLSVALDGLPVLIVEVASDTTYQSDLDLDRGKAFSYGQAGVPEYLVLDPTGEFVPDLRQGWRLHDGTYLPWLPNAEGRWASQEVPVALAVEGTQVAVYSDAGQRQPREGEYWQGLAQRDQAHAEELARLNAELANLRRRVDERRNGG